MVENRDDWDRKLDLALWAFMIAYKVVASLTPFKLIYGLEVVVPMKFVLPSLRVEIYTKLFLEDSYLYRV